jgi:hypothetical protein
MKLHFINLRQILCHHGTPLPQVADETTKITCEYAEMTDTDSQQAAISDPGSDVTIRNI